MYKNILIPVLLDERYNAKTAFLVARTLASEGAKFTVLHVMEPIPSYAATQIPADILAKSRSEVEQALKKLAGAMPGSSSVLASGHAGRFIVDYASKRGIDCIVIASHIPGISNIFLGSTADRVVRHAKCAVHVIR